MITEASCVTTRTAINGAEPIYSVSKCDQQQQHELLITEANSHESGHNSCAAEKRQDRNIAASGSGEDAEEVGNFECNICLELCRDPVVTMCGHLFCWPCLYSWLSCHSTFQECPVCRANVQGKVIPLYGRGKVETADSLARELQIPHNGQPQLLHIPSRSSAIRPPNNMNTSSTAMIPATRRRSSSSPATSFAASVLAPGRRRRYSNEKAFVLHWVFILVASLAVAAFLLN